MANLIDDVHAGIVNKISELGLEEVEVIEYSLLKGPAFRLDTRIDVVAFNHAMSFFLCDEYGRPHVVVILFHAGVAATGLLPHTALSRTKVAYLLPVFALGT